MRRFRFPFDSLERLRRRSRESCEQALAEANAQRDREQARLREAALEKLRAEAAWKKALPALGTLDIAEAARRQSYAHAAGLTVARAGQDLARAEEALASRRALLLEAWRKEQAVLRLKERRRQEWAYAADREEQAFLDEVGLRVRPAGEEA